MIALSFFILFFSNPQVDEPICDKSVGNCGHTWLTPLYFVAVTGCSVIFLTRMVSAIVVTNLEKEDILGHEEIGYQQKLDEARGLSPSKPP